MVRGGGHQGVSTLVVSRDSLVVIVHDASALLRTSDHTVNRLIQRLVVNHCLVQTGSQQGSLVKHVGQVGSGKTWGSTSNCHKVYRRVNRLALGVNLENRKSAFKIGALHSDLTVEPSGAQQCRVKDVRSVRGSDQDHASRDIEPVHLDQHLVQSLLALIVTATHTGATVTADSVDLVYEDDRRSTSLSLLEQVAHAASANANKHLDKVRTRDRVERNLRLACYCTSQQRLTGSWRTIKQHALRNLGADCLKASWILKEVFDLFEFFDRLVSAGNVLEGRLGHVFIDGLSFGLAKVHQLAAATGHLAHEEEQQSHNQ